MRIFQRLLIFRNPLNISFDLREKAGMRVSNNRGL